jgi:anaerobic selenocysteine-containing dehydrogenase
MSDTIKISRRDFLKIMGITGLILGVSGVSYKTLERVERYALEKGGKTLKEPVVEYKPNICGMCPQTCSIMVRVYKGRAERIFGNPYGFAFNRGTICARGNMGIYRLYNPDRLQRPLIRTGGERGTWNFKPISWSDAYMKVLEVLKNTEPRKVIWMAGWATCDLYMAFVVPFYKVFGFVNVAAQPFSSCMLPRVLAWTSTVGVGAHTQLITDFDNVRYLIVLMRNHAGSVSIAHASRLGQNLRRMKLVVLDPRFSEEAAKADEWIPIRPGTDLAFLLAMMNVILNEKLYDEEYLRKYTTAPILVDPDTLEPLEITKLSNGKVDFKVWDLARNAPTWSREAIYPALLGEFEVNGKTYITGLEALKRIVSKYTPEWASLITDVPAETIRRIAREFGTTRPATIDPGWHGTKTYNAFQTWRAVAILNALVGSPLRRGGVLLSNAGIEATLHPMSLGAPPTSDIYQEMSKVEIKLSDGTSVKGVRINLGRSYYPLLKIVEKEKGWVFFIAGANPVRTIMGLDENGKWWLDKLFKHPNVKMVIDYDILPQDTTLYADLILPDCTYLERWDRIRTVEYVPYKAVYTRVPVVEPVYDCRNFIDFLALLARDLGKAEEYAEALAGFLGLGKECVPEIVKAMKQNSLENPTFAKRLQEIQAECMGIDINELRKKGFILIAGKEEVEKENLELLEKGKLATPSGKVEVYSFMLLDISKRSGGIKPEWHPLIEWVPPQIEGKKLAKDEFYVIYGKVPTMTHTSTADNPYLAQKLTRDMYKRVWINSSRAKELGIKDGDLVEVCDSTGTTCVEARVWVTELVRPDTVFIPSNWVEDNPKLRFAPREVVPYNKVVSIRIEPIAGSVVMGDTTVRIRPKGSRG